MEIVETDLKDCYTINPKVFSDGRGFFLETYQEQRYSSILQNGLKFVQDNHSRSSKGVLRGLHLQVKNPQGKLVRVVRGSVFDVAVDLRPKSTTYRKWISVVLSGENKKQIWIPPGFAHGFQVLEDETDLEYKCTEFYDPESEICIAFNDRDLGISWPIENPILSKKDRIAKDLSEQGF